MRSVMSLSILAVCLGAAAQAVGFPLQGIGVMGFGLGGRAALLAATGRPVAALYPRCMDLHLPAEGDVLLLQGEDDSAGCETLAARPGIALQLLPGAAHGWDAPGAIWPSPGPKLGDPAGGPPIPARTDCETMRRGRAGRRVVRDAPSRSCAERRAMSPEEFVGRDRMRHAHRRLRREVPGR